MEDSRLVSEDANKREKNDEDACEEAPDRERLDHCLRLSQEAAVRQHRVEEGVAQDALRK